MSTTTDRPIVLGLLQNMWARDPAAMTRLIDNHGARGRRRAIAMFMPRTPSGRALRAAFGPLFGRIVWENVSTVVAGRSDGKPPADDWHIHCLLWELRPCIVIAFGRSAVDACRRHRIEVLIESRHPSPRAAGCSSLPSLYDAAESLRHALNNPHRKVDQC